MNGEITVFFLKKQSANLSQLLTTCPRRFFEEFFVEKVLFFINGHWATFLCHFDEILSVPMSVLLSVCQLDQFVVKKVLSNFFFLNQLQTLIAKWSVFVRFFFGQVDDTAFYESKVSIWWKKNVLTNLCLFHLSFADLEQKNQGFFGKQSAALSKWLTTGPRRFFAENFFFRKSSFSISALGIERIFSVISTEICRSRCQCCFLFVNMTSLWWKNFCQKFFFTSFLDNHPKITGLRSNFLSAKLTTLLSTSRKDHFEDITLFWQSFCLFFQGFLENERRNNGFFSQKTIGKFVTTAYHVSKKILWRFFLKKLFLTSLGIERFLYVISTKICRSVVSAAFCLSIWPVCGEKNFVKFFSPLFSDIDRKLISLCSNFFSAKWTTLLSKSTKDHFEDKHLLWNFSVCFFILLEHWTKN